MRNPFVVAVGASCALILGLVLLSGLTADIANADSNDVVISEFMYNPENDRDSDEFLEIHNTGTTSVDISDWCVDGASFCFPAGTTIDAGEFLVISPDAGRLASQYGATSAGTYDGGLKNGGETLQLIDAAENVIHEVDYDDGGAWPTLPDGEGPSIELVALDDRSSSWAWIASTDPDGHTAGGPNSVEVSGTPPTITDVTASTTTPNNGQSIVISATITDATSTPRLRWRTNLGSYNTITMSGTAPNYSATIPGQSAGDLVEYRVETTGAFDHSFPRVDDSRRTIGIFYPRNLGSNIPVFEWFIRDADYDEMITDGLFTNELYESALVVGDEVITDARVRVRGSSSRNSDKVNFKWEFPQGHDLEAEGLLVESIDEFAMQAELSDRTYGRSLLAWRAYEMVGIPTAQSFKIRVERNGEFQGLYSYQDSYDKTWRERFDIQESGSFYQADSAGFDQSRPIERRWDFKSGTEGYAPLEAMLDVIVDGTDAEREAYVRANFDIDQMIDYAAVTAITQHIDSSTKNFYVFLPDDTSRWQIIPWDLDHTFGNSCCPVFSDFVTPAEPGDKVNLMLEALLAVDEFEDQYFVRLAELREMILADGVLEDIFDNEVAIANAEAELDIAIWGQCCSVSFNRNELFDDIQARRDAIDNDPRVGGDPEPDEYVCSVSVVGDDVELFFDGPRGDREQLRSVQSGWVATVSGQSSLVVDDGAAESYFVRLRGNGYSVDPAGYTDVTCGDGGDPEPDEYVCSVSVVGDDVELFFDGPRGDREQLRSVQSGWVATVSGQSSQVVDDGAAESYFVRLRGNGYSVGPDRITDVNCN